jgi:hypothetical protein
MEKKFVSATRGDEDKAIGGLAGRIEEYAGSCELMCDLPFTSFNLPGAELTMEQYSEIAFRTHGGPKSEASLAI